MSNPAARLALVVVPYALAILALFVLGLAPADAALHPFFRWLANRFTALSSDASWFLGNALYRLLFGTVLGVVTGLPMALLVGRPRTAAACVFVALLPALALTAWASRFDGWLMFTLGVVAVVAPAIAWWSSRWWRRHTA